MKPEIETKKNRIEKNSTDIFLTDDYDLFKYKSENRKIRESVVNKIYKSIEKNGWFESSIIIVGDKMAVLDGQQRIAALKKFKLIHGHAYKIKYIVDRSFDDMKKIIDWQTARGSWTNDDYMESFIEQGIETYSIYKAFKEKYNFLHNVAMLLSFGKLNKLSKTFRSGDIIAPDWGMTHTYAKRLIEINKYYKFATHGAFVNAILFLWKQAQFDHEDFLHKLSLDREKLYKVTSVKQYVNIITDIYNYKRRDKVKFIYD